MSDQEKEIEEAFEKYLCEISDNGNKMINRVDLHGLSFKAGYQAAMERVKSDLERLGQIDSIFTELDKMNRQYQSMNPPIALDYKQARVRYEC